MPRVKRLMFRAETPDEVRETRSLPHVGDIATDLLVEHGHREGYYVRLSVDVVEGEMPEDTDWLERRLDREGADAEISEVSDG